MKLGKPITDKLADLIKVNFGSKSQDYIMGFDYLRALMSVFVVVLHAGGLGPASLIFTENFRDHVFTWNDFITFHILFLPVPVFVIISSYLQVSRGMTFKKLLRRQWRLVQLLLFWTLLAALWTSGWSGLINLLPTSFGNFLSIFFRANGTVYYFFAVLIVTNGLDYLMGYLKTPWIVAGLILTLGFLAICPLIGESHLLLISLWSPTNFLAYPFAAALIFRLRRMISLHRYRIVGGLVLLSALVAIWEWGHYVAEYLFLVQGYAFPTYTRPSLVLASTALLMVGLDPKLRSGPVIGFMSAYSLALYCLQMFWIEPIYNLIVAAYSFGLGLISDYNFYTFMGMDLFKSLGLDLVVALVLVKIPLFVLVVLACYLTAIVMQTLPLIKRFVV